jgi:hypothetical protein
MAILGLSLAETFTFYSERDEAKETPFTLGALTAEQRAVAADGLYVHKGAGTGESTICVLKNKVYLDAVRAGVKDWRNFKDEQGKDIPCILEDAKVGRGKILSDVSLNRLPLWLVAELGETLIKANDLTETTAKNSEGA